MTTAEEIRLAQDHDRSAYWKRWGPYLSDRRRYGPHYLDPRDNHNGPAGALESGLE